MSRIEEIKKRLDGTRAARDAWFADTVWQADRKDTLAYSDAPWLVEQIELIQSDLNRVLDEREAAIERMERLEELVEALLDDVRTRYKMSPDQEFTCEHMKALDDFLKETE